MNIAYDSMEALYSRAFEYYYWKLQTDSMGQKCREFLFDCGVDLIERASFGFAPSSWHSLFEHLSDSYSYGPEVLEFSKLVRLKARGVTYDVLRNRLVAPIRDRNNRLIGLTSVSIDPGFPVLQVFDPLAVRPERFDYTGMFPIEVMRKLGL